jgi:16S rRNA (cytosine967-C5)-methyltransferase
VQDVAASLPAHLVGRVKGKRVLDLCAAPGGKTAQLALAGAPVVAVDISKTRLKTLKANLARLGLDAETVVADATRWSPDERFDAVLLDAPCSSTGTIRRHPDIPYLKLPKDIGDLAVLQARLLDRAAALLEPGGTLVYSTCSLELEEGEAQIGALLARNQEIQVDPILQEEVFGQNEWLQSPGFLRTFPYQLDFGTPEWSGMDGFFAARLKRNK